ncbi:MAG: hypothetical protein R3B99_06325 [Polyangiales bacterium]
MAASTEHGRMREALVGVAIALLHVGVLALFGPSLGVSFPLDDAYTHQVYAEGLRYGDGLAYLPGVPAAGTSPLWALVLAPIARARGGVGAAHARARVCLGSGSRGLRARSAAASMARSGPSRGSRCCSIPRSRWRP